MDEEGKNVVRTVVIALRILMIVNCKSLKWFHFHGKFTFYVT